MLDFLKIISLVLCLNPIYSTFILNLIYIVYSSKQFKDHNYLLQAVLHGLTVNVNMFANQISFMHVTGIVQKRMKCVSYDYVHMQQRWGTSGQ